MSEEPRSISNDIGKILKSIDGNEFQLYGLYINRLNKEYDLVWKKFLFYFGLISGLLIVMIPMLNSIIKSGDDDNIYFLPVLMLTLVGIILSFIWFLGNHNARGWMQFIKDIIKELEQVVFTNGEKSRYAIVSRIDKDEPIAKKLRKYDVMIYNQIMPLMYSLIFFGIMVFIVRLSFIS